MSVACNDGKKLSSAAAGGWVKAMLFCDGFSGNIVRSFNPPFPGQPPPRFLADSLWISLARATTLSILALKDHHGVVGRTVQVDKHPFTILGVAPPEFHETLLFFPSLGRPVREFLAGLMLLAGMIRLAACANLDSLFAARAAARSRERPGLHRFSIRGSRRAMY